MCQSSLATIGEQRMKSSILASLVLRCSKERLLKVGRAIFVRKLKRYLLDGPGANLTSIFEDQNVRTDFLHQVQQMRTDDDGGPIPGTLKNRIFHPPDADGV